MGQCCSAPPDEGSELARSLQGRHVSRHFVPIKRLGVGSYGAVYLVERLSDQKQYALKETVLTELEEPLRWTAVNEIRVLASLDPHPHVVSCMEGFLDGNHLCIVMEYMPGGELADIIAKHAERDSLIPEADIWSYFIQVALGLKYLHVHCILHRDLKPQNILISEDGRLKLADLGVAHVVHGPKGSTKVQIGTPQYMAPEVWRREPYSFPADIWALGCVLHELCTLKPLFLAPTEQEVESRVIGGAVPPISRRYSQELHDLIARLLEYNADDRPTIDDVLSCQAVRSRMLGLFARNAGGAGGAETEAETEAEEQSFASMMGLDLDMQRAASSVLDPIEIPANLSLLNARLPKPRYSTGLGLVTILAEESSEYRDFAIGPADLPEFEMPRQAPMARKGSLGLGRVGRVGSSGALGRKGSGALGGRVGRSGSVGGGGGSGQQGGSGALGSCGDPPPSSKGSGALSVADTAYDGAGGAAARVPAAGAPPGAAGGGEAEKMFSPFGAGGGEGASGQPDKQQQQQQLSRHAAAMDSAQL